MCIPEDCPNSGGKRIFPGLTSPDDQLPDVSRRVKLVATICPPMAGITVHFKVWDVDDTSGPDNRPGGKLCKSSELSTETTSGTMHFMQQQGEG